MFKLSLILLSIIILLLVGLDSNFFNEETKILENNNILKVEKEEPQKIDEEITVQNSIVKKEIEKEMPIVEKVDIYSELKKIMEEAITAYTAEDFKKTIECYDRVIELSKDSQEVNILELFASAHFNKASINRFFIEKNIEKAIKSYDIIIKKFENKKEIELLKIYAKAIKLKANISERDNALELYDKLINKFSKSSDVELLELYANAQINKSYLTTGNDTLEIYNQIIENLKNIEDKKNKKLLSIFHKAQLTKAYILEGNINQKEEAIEVYDEIIKKFSSLEGEMYQAMVDDANFRKSFLLMGQNNEGSMEIYDRIINKYETKNSNNLNSLPVPLEVEYSIINNIELSLITNTDDTQYRELADKYISGKKDTKPQVDMLEILRDAQVSNQDEALKNWKEENQNFSFSNWSFEELKQWNEQMEEGEQKDRIRIYLNEFEKYNNRQNYNHTK